MEDETQEDKLGGLKFDSDKPGTDLLPASALIEIAEVFDFGAKKYSRFNWLKGMKVLRLYGALLRHLFAWYMREDIDSESGKRHLAHAGCCMLMLIELSKREELDDRPRS